MPAPKEVLDLISRFEQHLDAYKSGSYNETQLRRDFLDPFFKALGWDVDNAAGYAEAYRDVILEDSVRISGTLESPDYSFGIGRDRKFFLEAKKPSIDIKEEVPSAYQLRRYAWSAKLVLSILSDFEELSVYDGRIKPAKDDPASTARVFYCNFRQYAEKWDWIASIFSREAVLKGSFDKYAEGTRSKRGTAQVDEDFLITIEGWREQLARNLALRNPALSQRELNFAVQRILDRIVFLRIAEDRGIEPYGQLYKLTGLAKSKIQDDGRVEEEPPGGMAAPRSMRIYPLLCEIFERADSRYNSGLFHFSNEKNREETPDTLTLGLQVDDSVLKDILIHLYYPNCDYAFAFIPAEILGHVYEQFLGKVIRLTEGHRAVVEEKPEVRKAGGVYYTPAYIVDYIVRQTIAPLIEDKSPTQIEKIHVLDPACGSGSFLLGAYQFLLDWHLRYYLDHTPAKWAKGKNPAIYETAPNARGPGKGSGNWRLTTEERKRILLNNIYGADIDSQAVEVTKLSLLLKVLEGEAREYRGHQMDFHRVLPDLGKNIKCGNSLIGPDFYQQSELNLLDDEERLKINVFDWNGQDGFQEIMKNGGFDAVLGNPPYLGGREWKEENGNQYDYFIERYQVAEYQFDIYALFIEKGFRLARNGGYIGFITPNTWLNNQSNTKLRKFILESSAIQAVADYSRIKVFKDATVLPIITIFRKGQQSDPLIQIHKPQNGDLISTHQIKQRLWADDDLCIFNIDLTEEEALLRDKINRAGLALENLADVRFGIKIYETGKGDPPQKSSDAKTRCFEATRKIDATYRRYLEGKDVESYTTKWQKRWLKYGQNLAAPRDPSLFSGERLVFRRIVGHRLIGTLLDSDFVTSQLLQIVKPRDVLSPHYLLGILNSRLIAFYFRKKYNRQDITFPEIRIYELSALPIKSLDLTKKFDRELHEKIAAKVKLMLSLHEKMSSARTPHEKTVTERQIAATDLQVDRLVYDLYGMTKKEIDIIEMEIKK